MYNVCKVNGCTGKVIGLGLCCKHYYRFKRNGSPYIVQRNRCGYSKKYKKLYSLFWSMHDRCEKEGCRGYKNYGARGIRVCDRWSGVDGLKNFIDDMGEPKTGLSLDRIDVNGNYCPENCRWADKNTQAANVRKHGKYSKKPGVTFNKFKNVWWAFIQINGKRYVKIAHSEEEAILLREQLEIKYLGHKI